MKNVGKIDKIIRFVLAFVFAAIAYKYQVELGVWFWAFLGAAVIMIGTAFINFCPLYRIVGMSTTKK